VRRTHPDPVPGHIRGEQAALTLLTDTLRVELAPQRIAVTGVYPGTVNTPFEKNALREGDSYTLCPFESGCGSPPEVIARGVLQAARRRLATPGSAFRAAVCDHGMFWPGWLDARMAEVRDAVEPPPSRTALEDLLIPR